MQYTFNCDNVLKHASIYICSCQCDNMACQQLVQHVQASAAYMRALPDGERAALMKSQLRAVKHIIEKISGPVDALEAARAVREHYMHLLQADDLAELIGMLNAASCRLPLATQDSFAGNQQQHWEDNFWKLVPKDIYDGLGNRDMLSTLRMPVLFEYLASRGLRVASGKTIAAMLALFFYVDGVPAHVGGHPALLYAAMAHVRDSWKNFIKDYMRRNKHARASFEWPGPPAGAMCVQLDMLRFLQIYNLIPARSSRGDVKKNPNLTLLQRGISRAMTLDEVHQGTAPAAPAAAAMLMDIGNRGENNAILTLVPAPAGPASSDGKNLQLIASTPVASARKSLAEVTAELQAAQQQKRSDANAAAAKPKKPKIGKKLSRKGSAGTKARGRSIRKKQKSKQAAASGLASASNRAAPELAPANASKDPVCVCKTCGSPDGLQIAGGRTADTCIYCYEELQKEPAAKAPKPKAKAKTKAKAKAKAKAKPPQRLDRNASLREKRNFWTTWGCSKCRWYPGCTPSCWKARKMEMPEDVE